VEGSPLDAVIRYAYAKLQTACGGCTKTTGEASTVLTATDGKRDFKIIFKAERHE